MRPLKARSGDRWVFDAPDARPVVGNGEPRVKGGCEREPVGPREEDAPSFLEQRGQLLVAKLGDRCGLLGGTGLWERGGNQCLGVVDDTQREGGGRGPARPRAGVIEHG
jgi:hypothetical protein